MPDTDTNLIVKKVLFIAVAVLCLMAVMSPPWALLMGIIFAQIIGHPFLQYNKRATTLLLQVSVVGLGFGMNVHTAMQAGKQGFIFTLVSIVGTLVGGILLGKLLSVDKKTSYLVSGGTAICGGSAIAAFAPVIQAEEKQISVALGIVFILNSVALFLFPYIGHLIHLNQIQFGLWSAIAIHDTSSVVGAASKYGPLALETATTVKLTRALWIIPITLIMAFIFKNKNKKIKIPYFIGLFVVAMLINTYMPAVHEISPYIVRIAKAGLTLTLFLIGAGLSNKVIRSVGVKPFIQGVTLWVLVSVISLWVVYTFIS